MAAQTQAPSIFKLFYTHKRTQILLEAKGVKVKNIEKVSITKPNGEFYNMVHVVYRVKNGGRCSTFISCREYLARATEKRKEEAEKYVARQNFDSPSEWRVYSKANPNKVEQPNKIEDSDAVKYRTVYTSPNLVCCDCEDYNNQCAYLSQHPYLWEKVIKKYQVCKHIFTTLQTLNFSSLSSYLKAWQPGGRLNNLAVTMNRTTRRTRLTLQARVAPGLYIGAGNPPPENRGQDSNTYS